MLRWTAAIDSIRGYYACRLKDGSSILVCTGGYSQLPDVAKVLLNMKRLHRGPTAPALLPYMIRHATLLKVLPVRSVQALRATNKELYRLVYDNATSVQLRRGLDIKLLFRHSWPKLTTLKLSNANMCACSVTLLINGALTGLQTLDLSQNPLQLPDVKQLARGNWPLLSCPDLTKSLSSISFIDRGQSCHHLATSKWPALTALHIRKNYLEAKALAELVQADWPLLQALDSSYNFCGYSPFNGSDSTVDSHTRPQSHIQQAWSQRRQAAWSAQMAPTEEAAFRQLFFRP